MIRRSAGLALLALATACSQRAPWRTVPSPAPASTPRPAAASSGAPARLPTPADVPAVAADATSVAHLQSLYFPVPGEDSTRLDDSFDAPRDGGSRKHNAIDIMAPRGTPVLSVQDGRVLKLSKNAKGGITVYATDLDEHYVYYYAHLDHYHANMYNGRPLMRGDTLGYVGTTGNAPANLPHLHFQVMRMPPDGKYWSGDPVNPFPLLRNAVTTASAGQ